MAAPDFNKRTIDTLAKRAAFKCSNPDCRAATVGPNTAPDKSTLIGEAAHIHGARSQSKRYISDMTDSVRAEITNGIWLCRNCHKLIDTDETRFSSSVLFSWRKQHEEFVLSELGNSTDKIHFKQQSSLLKKFEDCPPVVYRIIFDKPNGWEWRLAAELMRYFNKLIFRKIKDLHQGLYVQHRTHISEDNIQEWVEKKLNEMSALVSPITKLLESLTHSFGKSGEAGNIEEIYHICTLIREYLERILEFEETLYFANVPKKAEKALGLLKGCLSSQMQKLESIPVSLDEVVALLDTNHGGTREKPLVIEKTISIELPDGWEKKMKRELSRLYDVNVAGDSNDVGCASTVFALVMLIIIIMLIF